MSYSVYWKVNREAAREFRVEIMMSVEGAAALREELTDADIGEQAGLLRSVLGDALERARVPQYLEQQPPDGALVRLGTKLGTVQKPIDVTVDARLVLVLFDEFADPVYCFYGRLERA